jgi:hypothetical protein
MGRPCTVCSSPRHERVDLEIVSGETLAQIAKRYRLSSDSILRHKKKHLSPALVKVALEKVQIESAGLASNATADRVESLIDRLEILLSIGEERESLTAAANVARELRQCLELQARLRGDLTDRPQSVTVNVLSTPEFANMVAGLIEALAPWPEARIAAANVLDVEEVS